MSNKSGVSSQVISLPQGGGAVSGLGETFSPDLHTGTGNFTVPLSLPPGRNGFQPQLSLVYSTGNGNGPFGLGWNLSIPGVSRKTSKGIPRYTRSGDTFILSGAEDLIPVETDGQGTTTYRPRTEGLFARIKRRLDGGNDYWQVESKDGLTSLYGTQGCRSDASSDPLDPAVVSDPDNRQNIFAWKLTRTTDPFGNRIDYVYERELVDREGPHHWDQVYLSEIRYVDYGDPEDPEFLVRVRFTYEDHRPDPFSEYRSGFEVRTRRRCTQIAVHTEDDSVPLRTWSLVYLDQQVLPPQWLPLNGVSLLSQVKVTGYEGEASESLPPLEFRYSEFRPRDRKYQACTATSGYLPEKAIGHPDYEFVDLFGNGLPDIIQMGDTIRYWRNRGGGHFDVPRPMDKGPAGVRLADPGVQLADMNGDGRSDLLVTDGTRGGYYPLSFQGGFERRRFVSYSKVPSFNLEDPQVRLVDLDGDGITDALRTGTALELYYQDRDKGWTRVEVRERRNPREFPNVDFQDSRVKLADMNGDGLQDIVLVHSGRIEYWPYLGYGRWGSRVTMRNSPRLEDTVQYTGVGYDPKRVLLGDVDGDGLADLVYVGHGFITVWINQSGNGWSPPFVIRGTPTITDLDSVRLVDLLGNGTAGILWSYDYGTKQDSIYKFLDLTGGTKPYLLHEMDNHMGALTRVAYASSTRDYLRDERKSATRRSTSLPFPVQVVSQVEAIDLISNSKHTTEYRYHHGYWDGEEREFRGFGRVDQRDTEVFYDYNANGLHGETQEFNAVSSDHFSPPTETRTPSVS